MKERLLDFFENGQYAILCRWIGKFTWGITRHDLEEVHINVHAVLTWVLLHEYLHVEYPLLSEHDVCDRTDRAMRRLSKDAIIAVADKILERLWTTDAALDTVAREHLAGGNCDMP